MKYLIVKCDDENDRIPLCVTDDKSKYGNGYEVYEIQLNGKLKLIKEYDVALKTGTALYKWNSDMSDYAETHKPDKIIAKWEGRTLNSFSKTEIKKIAKQAHFTEDADDIIIETKTGNAYGEEIDGNWVVLGEYRDNIYDLGL